MANVSVDIDAAVLKHSFRFVKDLVRNERHRVFIANHDRNKKVIRATAVPSEMENLRNEALAHAFLRRRTPKGARFAFPATEIWEDAAVFVSASEYIPRGWLGQKDPQRLTKPLTDRDLEDIFQVMLFLHEIPKIAVPGYFMRRAAKEFTLEKTLAKNRGYFEPALGTLLSKKEGERLQRMMRAIGYRRRFVHHDILPSNLARLPDGRLMVNDAEFARWEMKWYDVAYTFLQMSLLYGHRALGKRMLRYFVRRFKEELPDEDIEHEIFFPLGYWIAANMFIAMKEPKQRTRVRKMFELILKQDLKTMMGT